MPKEVMLKTHLIIKDIQDEYKVKWCGRIIDTKPLIKDGKPVFAVFSKKGRVELNTVDIKQIEDCAKRLTEPKGREAFTTDKSYIYIKEIDGNEKLMGVVTHNRIKTFAPMYDKIGCR